MYLMFMYVLLSFYVVFVGFGLMKFRYIVFVLCFVVFFVVVSLLELLLMMMMLYLCLWLFLYDVFVIVGVLNDGGVCDCGVGRLMLVRIENV